MSVYIGEVETFKDTIPDKEQALKILEEAAEVFGAWQMWIKAEPDEVPARLREVIAECADVVQAVCNLVDGFGEGFFEDAMEECAERNRIRGRM